MKERKNKFDTTFVPSKFIQPLSKKSRIDLVEYLLSHKYILRIEPFDDRTWHEKIKEETKQYKLKPKFYLLLPKLLNLGERDLFDTGLERSIITNLHHLQQQRFNHWAHNYRHINIEAPDDVWDSIMETEIIQKQVREGAEVGTLRSNIEWEASLYGNKEYKQYDNILLKECEDYFGRPHNLLNGFYPTLLPYTSLTDAVEVGIHYSEGVIMADHLYRSFGDNDFSTYFFDEEVVFQEKVTEAIRLEKPLPAREVPLFTPEDDELMTLRPSSFFEYENYQQARDEIVDGLFGFKRNPFFEELFPIAWDFLYKVKANKKGDYTMRELEDGELVYLHYHEFMFKKFIDGISPTITLSDKRIEVIKKDDRDNPTPFQREILERGQLYYKVTELVWKLREVKIMRAIWKKLKRHKILFIPLFDRVLVENREEVLVKNITLETWREHLDPKIKIFPKVVNH